MRLARLIGGAWQISQLDTTTYRVAPGGSNASSVGLGFDPSGTPWVTFVDQQSHSVRIVTPGAPSVRIGDAPPTAARVAPSFGAGGAEAAAVSSLAGDNAPLHVLYVGPNGHWRGTMVGLSGSSAPAIVAFSGRRPVLAFRDPQAVVLATPGFAGTYGVQTVLKQGPPSSSLAIGSLSAARVRDDIGIALVSPKGLLEFAAHPLD